MDSKTCKYYQEHAKRLCCRYESSGMSKLHKLLESSFHRGDNLFEIGCGSGRDALFMLNSGFKITACDCSLEMIKQAKIHHPKLANNLLHLNIPSELVDLEKTFKGVYSIATLMHLTKFEINQTIQSISGLLLRGGKLFFSVSIQRNDIAENERDTNGRLFTSLPQKEWESICYEHGFKKIFTSNSDDGLGRNEIVWLNCLMEKL